MVYVNSSFKLLQTRTIFDVYPKSSACTKCLICCFKQAKFCTDGCSLWLKCYLWQRHFSVSTKIYRMPNGDLDLYVLYVLFEVQQCRANDIISSFWPSLGIDNVQRTTECLIWNSPWQEKFQIMYNLDKVHMILEEIVIGGCIVETCISNILEPLRLMDGKKWGLKMWISNMWWDGRSQKMMTKW